MFNPNKNFTDYWSNMLRLFEKKAMNEQLMEADFGFQQYERSDVCILFDIHEQFMYIIISYTT